jgi:RHS repeat-associated protein
LQRYQLVEVGDPPQVEIDLDTRQFQAAMEYRYDSGRQRYMVRPRDAESLAPPQDGSGDYDLDIGAWHDYSGAAIYGDYAVEAAWDGEHQTVTAANVTETLAHEPGMVQYDRAAAAGDEQLFLHGNLVGTTERITDGTGAINHRAVYTAFGEPIFPSPSQGEGQGEGTIPTRYGYVGAWGYQGNPLSVGQPLGGGGGLCDPANPQAFCDPVALLGWLHVGERYYDPASGRFMQRDPIGINGGPNVYAYVENEPPHYVDPPGHDRWYIRRGGHSEVFFRNPNRPGEFIGFDFGPVGGKGNRGFLPSAGQVHRLPTGELPEGVTCYASTAAEDADDLARIENQVITPPTFSISGIGGSNCLGWTLYWARRHVSFHNENPNDRVRVGWQDAGK